MMFNNPYLAQRLAQERTQEVARETERTRLVCIVNTPKKASDRPEPVVSMLSGLWYTFTRPQT